MTMKTATAFVPGFATRDEALKAGASFYRRTNGRPGVEGRDFILTPNEHGRWHFDPVPGFPSRENAVKAAGDKLSLAGVTSAREGHEFIINENAHGRWEYALTK